jgi:hypothetical protein
MAEGMIDLFMMALVVGVIAIAWWIGNRPPQ